MLRNKEIRKFVLFLLAGCSIFTIICFFINKLAGIISILSLFIPFLLFFLFTYQRYKNISKLSNQINRIVNGEISFDIRSNEEGELSILYNEIYKVTSKLIEQADILEKEKAKLADSLSDISHQLKTPLTSLLIMSELLQRNDLPQKKREEFSENIRIGLLHMEWLVLSLLKIAKLDADSIILEKREVSVEDIIIMSLQNLEIILESKKQHVVLLGEKDITIICDINWTVEALLNIIKNASESSKKDSKIIISWNTNPLFTQIIIEDNGGGIEKEDIPYLFKRFYKRGNVSKESTGIGLALAFEIMRKQNGNIEVKNKPGVGAAFILKFYKIK